MKIWVWSPFSIQMRLIRATILGEPTERMASILKDNAVHFTETTGKEYAGRKAVIERFRFVQENTNHEYFVHTATLTEIKGGEVLSYDVGKRCLVLACDDPDNLDAILFVDTDEAGDIAAIYISRDPRYTFKIDLPPKGKTSSMICRSTILTVKRCWQGRPSTTSSKEKSR